MAQDIDEVSKVMNDNDPVCLWTADLYTFTLKLYNPSGYNKDETGKLVRRRQLHIDERLRKKLYEKTESRAQIEGIRVLPTSHISRILCRVFVRIIQKILLNATEQEKRIWLHELVDMVQEELPKLSDDDIRRISKELHEIATKIKILVLESTSNTLRSKDLSFRVRISAKSPRTVENLIEDKYIEEICKERSPQKSLLEFKEYLRHNVGSLDYHFSKLNGDRS
jgi:hypothetical protein